MLLKMNQNENESEDVEYKTRKVLDVEKLNEECYNWLTKNYNISGAELMFLTWIVILIPPILPLLVLASVVKHFTGKNYWKTETYKVVNEE